MKSYKCQKALERSWNHPVLTRAQTVMSQTQSLPLHTTEGGGTSSLHQGTFLPFPKHRHQEVKNNRQQEFKPCWLTVWVHSSLNASQAGPDSAVVFISTVQLRDVMSSLKKKKKSIIPIKSCSSPLTPFFLFFLNEKFLLKLHISFLQKSWEHFKFSSLQYNLHLGNKFTGFKMHNRTGLDISKFSSTVLTLHYSLKSTAGGKSTSCFVCERKILDDVHSSLIHLLITSRWNCLFAHRS